MLERLDSLLDAIGVPVGKDMEVITNSPRVRASRKTTLELLLSDHPSDYLQCVRNLNCELQALSEAYGIRRIRFEGERSIHPVDDSNPSIVRENEKCVICRRCV